MQTNFRRNEINDFGAFSLYGFRHKSRENGETQIRLFPENNFSQPRLFIRATAVLFADAAQAAADGLIIYDRAGCGEYT